MKTNDTSDRLSQWLRWGVFAAAVFLTVYFLPRSDGRHYSYEVNRPWSYSLLTAPFDIPVYLDSVSARQLRDSLEAGFEPALKRDLNTEKNVIASFAGRLNSPDTHITLSPLERNAILAKVKGIYEKGVVETTLYEAIAAGRLPRARLIHDNVATSISTSGYLSPRRAYARLDSALQEERHRSAISSARIAELIVPNIVVDSLETARLHDDMMQRAMAPVGVVQKGERIIDRGVIVTPRLYTLLNTYEDLLSQRGIGTDRYDYYPVMGQVLFVMLLYGALYGFMFFFRPDYYASRRTMLMTMSLLVAFTLFAFAMGRALNSGLYMMPFTIIPLVLVVFLDSRTAFYSHLTAVLLTTLVAPSTLEFVFLQFIAGVVAITSTKELSRRSQLIRTAMLIFVSYALSYTAIELIHNGTLESVSLRAIGFLGVNAVLISFAYIVIFILEKLFGFTSKVTLVELSDINNPTLRELSEECPGTFQHSMAVSNLASAAASRIGANVTLVRAGALYHDIGKIDNPAFFTENQHGVNPHDSLSAPQSARIVIGHVADGLRRAEKEKLPAVIRSFISEHHGRGKARYFYNTWCNEHPDETPDEDLFTYPGPNPRSRETSILMMADAIEAASRSLSEHTPEAISALVNRIIDGQIAEGLHDDSPLSFRDVNIIKETFASRLRTMYHSRISYPELVK